MVTDYKSLQQDPKDAAVKAVRRLMKLYSEKSHFVYEFIQNAEDAGRRNGMGKQVSLGFVLREREVVIWNDGHPFTPEDIRGLCSVGNSTKDLTNVGTFGIGFKSVYLYTDVPEVYSGRERFRIRDYFEPEAIQDLPDDLRKWVEEGKTVFRLPFKGNLQDEDRFRLCGKLRNLGGRSLLFLRNLQLIEWSDGEAKGVYRRYYAEAPVRGARRIILSSEQGRETQSEEWLVFSKVVTPPQNVIAHLLGEAEDDDERQRIQRSAGKEQPVDIAFRLRDGAIVPEANCVFFSYLPTEKETHLRFLFQARLQTTPARDNVPSDSSWNQWLVEEVAHFFPEVLRMLRDAYLITPSFLSVLPLEEDNVLDQLSPIVDTIISTFRQESLLPTQGGGYAAPHQVFSPHSEDLRQLISDPYLAELTGVANAVWLHRSIRVAGEYVRSFKFAQSVGVKEIGVGELLKWLESKDVVWFENQELGWVRRLYLYLAKQKSEVERIKVLPLVRLQNGKHVCADEHLAFLPPQQDVDKFSDFLSSLPVVEPSLVKDETGEDISRFLTTLGVKRLDHAELIRSYLLPLYQQETPPSLEDNKKHLRYLKEVWGSISYKDRTELQNAMEKLPLLFAYRSDDETVTRYVSPMESYLPQAYTGSPDLEIYFTHYSDAWFVGSDYLGSAAENEAWSEFLQHIGCRGLPRLAKVRIVSGGANLRDECKKRGIDRAYSTAEEAIEEFRIHALSQALERISTEQDIRLASIVWRLLSKIVDNNPRVFTADYNWFYYTWRTKQGRSDTLLFLQEQRWLPDEQENLRKPSELFAPTEENRRLLGDSVTYLHPSFDVSDSEENRPARQLAQKLGVNLSATTESVMRYLHNLSGKNDVSKEVTERIYFFLGRQGASRGEDFLQNRLLFTPSPAPRWWRADEVFWENEEAVFGEHRGYLKQHYPERLKSFFIGVGVSERASAVDYARAIRDLAQESVVDEEIQKRLQILYRRIWNALQDDRSLRNSEEWKELSAGKYWLGKIDEVWSFFDCSELVHEDHDYLAGLFRNRLPFWAFRELADLAKELQITPVSRAEPTFTPCGDKECDNDWSERIKSTVDSIRAFLSSPTWANQLRPARSTECFREVSVYLVEELRVTYRLKNVCVEEEKPRPCFFDPQSSTIFIALDADERDYPDLIGDALQEYFGVPELREFIKDLLTGNIEAVIERWRRRGLQYEPLVSQEAILQEAIKKQGAHVPPSPETTNEVSQESGEPSQRSAVANGEHQGAAVSKEGGSNTTQSVSVPASQPLPNESRTVPSSYPTVKHTTTSTGGATLYYAGGWGGHTESEEHRRFKEAVAGNPILAGLAEHAEPVTEYEFRSGDRVDILFKENGLPVPVEIELTFYLDESKRYQGVWQAVKYKHLAAVEWHLPCEQVRAILVAPSIPEDVKAECERTGVEYKEVRL